MAHRARAAILFEHGRPLEIREIEVDPPKAGEVLIRMAASGVCRSDYHSVRGIHPHVPPIVLGHEGSAVVEEVGEGVEGLEPGDHVVCSWLPSCGSCDRCASGRPVLCRRVDVFDAGFLSDGTTPFHLGEEPIHVNVPSSFAEWSVVPVSTAFTVDHDLPLEQVALLGCAVMTGVGAVRNTAGVRAGESVVVIGCGAVGLSAIQGARIAGASPIVAVDVVEGKLALAASLGAHETVRSGDDVADRVLAVTGGGADYAFECLGRPATIELATAVLAPGGTAVLVGMAAPDADVHLPALEITTKEKTVTGSWYGSVVPDRDFPVLAGLLASGELDLSPLIARTIRLDEINDALARFESGAETRSVIVYPAAG
jgi:S-(hydroxymethyl)glutathione dehydrogenase/alcohol dehydrogenase